VHEFDDAAGDVESHAVVDAASGEDDLGVVAYFLGFVGEVVGVDANAVATYEAWFEGKEVPFGLGGGEDVSGVDIEFFKDEGELVHEADVHVALGVFDGFGGLGYFDAWGEVGAGFDDGEVELVYLVRSFGGGAGGDLEDVLELADFVAWVDALRAVAYGEILVVGEAAGLFEDRYANFFSAAGVGGAFVDH